jgi:hypothetical protein
MVVLIDHSIDAVVRPGVFLLFDTNTHLFYWVSDSMIPWIDGYKGVKYTLDRADAITEFRRRSGERRIKD